MMMMLMMMMLMIKNSGCWFNVECPRGVYGAGCRLSCDCHNGAACDRVTGQCICIPGWTGPTCNVQRATD